MKQNYWNRTFDKNKKYIWISERGKTTCEKCQSLNGKIFSGDKVPNRPHPNCKCEVEEYHGTTIQNVPQETHDNPKRVQKLEKQANDLEKQVIILRGEIQKANRIEAVYNYKKMYEQKIKELADVKNAIKKMKNKLDTKIQQKSKKAFDKTMDSFLPWNKEMFDAVIKIGGILRQESGALWEISSSKFKSKIAQEYIKRNGTFVNKISDLKSKKIEDFIRKKLEVQIGTTEAKGILFNHNSSLANKIVRDEMFLKIIQKYAQKHKNKLIFKRTADESSFGGFSNGDLRTSLGNIDIKNVFVDEENNLWMLIIDVYDFNPNENDPFIKRARKLQETGKIDNYYSIIPIKIPLEKWKTF